MHDFKLNKDWGWVGIITRMRSITCACVNWESRSLKVRRLVLAQEHLRMRQSASTASCLSNLQIYSFSIVKMLSLKSAILLSWNSENSVILGKLCPILDKGTHFPDNYQSLNLNYLFFSI